MDVSGIILSAGESKRMGQPKALLDFYGTPLIVHLAKEYLKGGVSELIIVSNLVISEKVEQAFPLDLIENIEIAINENYKSGMFSSVKKGIENTNYENVLLGLVDNPLINSNVIRTLIDSFDGKSILIPLFNGRKGHPIIIPSEIKKEIMNENSFELSLRDILLRHEDIIRFVSINDESVIIDIDVYEDYEKALKLWKR